ncbi:unnamed protein product [Darwinula stevensoni]|uniref:Uncharacterized protein n=1 Tax=Darwinula stevensoni TaxID=69355 RepID=A0A7R9A9P1_9CRUS|nr:unnamed protein product [Darwinula stevensoni]CAG0897629.1 unnamed protein product [Darwinula stevensoni]
MICAALLWNAGKVSEADGSKGEARLKQALFEEYPKIRPVADSRDPLVVSFSLGLFRVLQLDVRGQTLGTLVEVVERWNDTYLRWNPEDHSGINRIAIPYDAAWIPDIILYNSASEEYSEGLLSTSLVLDHTGEVMLEIAANFRSSCNVEAKSFPFDRQTCTMLFMSWTQESDKIQMKLVGDFDRELQSYMESSEFQLESYTAVQKPHVDPCCVHPFSAVEYSITISRKATFFLVINYILPVVVIDVIALLSFLVPCESGEKVTLGITTMLTMIIFLTSSHDLLPPTEHIPVIGKFYCACICLVGLEVALSMWILHVFHLKGVHFPQWTQRLCLILAKLPFMRQPKFNEVRGEKGKEKELDEDKGIWVQRSRRTNGHQNPTLSTTDGQGQWAWGREKETWMARGRAEFEVDLENWRMASRILDRFFLYLFFLLNVAIPIGIIMSSQ